ACGDPVAGERLLRLEALPNRSEHRHLPVGPGDPANALGCEGDVLHIMSFRRGHSVLPFVGGQATSSRSCFRCSQSSAVSSVPASHVSTELRSSGSRRNRAAKATSVSSTSKRPRSSRND